MLISSSTVTVYLAVAGLCVYVKVLYTHAILGSLTAAKCSCINSNIYLKSFNTILHIDGEIIEKDKMQYIGKILEKSDLDFGKDGIENVHLLNGDSEVTYEEMEFVMNLDPRTKVFSINLKQEITSSKHQCVSLDSCV